jgi:hypothetical protein
MIYLLSLSPDSIIAECSHQAIARLSFRVKNRVVQPNPLNVGLKAQREQYGGQSVALDGEQLVADRPNYRVAREGVHTAGRLDAFVTYLSKPKEVADEEKFRALEIE